jgi:amino acid adenylation domain-containing protein
MQTKQKISSEQLARLLAKKKGNEPVASLAAVKLHGFPLSSAQARVLVAGEDAQKARAAYSGFALMLHGPLQLSALRAAWLDVVNVHEVLRTAVDFDPATGQLGQRVAEQADAPFFAETLPALASDADALAALERFHAHLNFDLPSGQVAKAHLVLRDAGSAMLAIAVHHIAFDGWSRQVLIDDLGRFYQARCEGLPLPPEHRKAYRAWASEEPAASAEAFAPSRQYWQSRLQGLQDHDLFTLVRRPRQASAQAALQRLVFAIEAGLARQVRLLAEQYGATQYAVLLTVYKLLLARWTLQTDICVGSPVANRTQPALENVVGCFVNAVAMRSTVLLDQSFAALLRQEQAVVLDALEHQSLPFDAVVRLLIQGQRPVTTPLFQAFFVLQAPTACAGRFGPSLTVQLRPMADDTAQFDLSLNIEALGDGFQAELLVAGEIGGADRFASHFLHLLACVTAAPEARLDTLALLPQAELRQITALAHGQLSPDSQLAGNDGSGGGSLDLITSFKRIVALYPATLALDHIGGLRLTYVELAVRADAAAHALAAQGVRRGDRVALLVKKGAQQVIMLLAILECGASFLCIDPALPDERMALLLDDAGIGFVLTEAPDRSALTPFSTRGRVIDINALPALTTLAQAAGGFAVQCGQYDVAYLIYTSGTTGRPKGISVSHRATASLALERAAPFFSPGRRVLGYAAQSFDMTIFEIWGALLQGATLVFSDHATESIAALAQTLVQEKIETLGLTPAVFHRLIAEFPEALSGLKCLHAGGEPVQFDAVAKFLALPGAQAASQAACYVSEYGPAENAVISSNAVIRRDDLAAFGGEIPIGRPLAERSCYLLDAQYNLVPVGAPGILFVGGAGLANGYVGNPMQTAERFVPHPFSGTAGERLYNTGDLAYIGPSGDLYFLGRADTQVKINGVRIELEEVEAAMIATGLVQGCAAAVKLNERQEKLLVAYCVFPAGVNVGERMPAIRARLAETLPQFFIPALMAPVPSLPLSAAGKVDRNMLPGIAAAMALLAQAQPTQAADAPASPTEQVLIELFRSFLKVDNIGRSSRFFELGGHSLLVLEMIGKIAAVCGVRLGARSFFANCPIADIAAEIDQLRAMAACGAPPAVPQAAIARALPVAPLRSAPLSAEQNTLWWLMQMSPQAVYAYNIPFAIHMHGMHDGDGVDAPQAISRAVRLVLARHALLRLRVRSDVADAVGVAEQYLADDVPLLLPVFDFNHLSAPEQAERRTQLQQEMACHRFVLEHEAPIRFALERHADGHWALLVVVHHLVFDGWSKHIFLTAFKAALDRSHAMDASDTAALGGAAYDDGYFRYVQEQRAMLQGPGLAAGLAYWRQRLHDLPPPLVLNGAKTRPALQTWHGDTVSMAWTPAESDRVKALAKRHGASDFVVLLALVKGFLARVCRSGDIVVGAPASTRLQAAYADTIGYFVNMIASRSQIDARLSFDQVLQQESAHFYADLQQALPFDLVLNALKLPRDVSRTPIFQICVSHHHRDSVGRNPAVDDSANGSRVEIEELALAQAKFDLSIDLSTGDASGSVVQVSFNYNTDVLQQDEVLALQQAFHAFCNDVTASPAAPLAAAGLLSAGQQAILTAMNDTSAPLAWSSVPAALAAVARQNPQRLALIDDTCRLTFGALLDWIGATAAALLQAGLRPGGQVVVLCDRNIELVGATLAVLCAGGVYAPADPDNPPARIAEIAQHCGAQLILCKPEHLVRCPASVRALAIAPPPASGQQAESVEQSVQADEVEQSAFWQLPGLQAGALAATDTAYVMYTSGSTGKPKGVAVSHAGILRLATGAAQLVLAGDDRMAQATSCAFDVSVWEIYGALLNGIALVMIPKPVLLSAALLRDHLHHQQVTHMFVTPTLAKNLQDACGDVFGALSELWVGGEAVGHELAQVLLHAYPRLRLVNGYGPTECTVFAATKLITGATLASGVIPIGTPYSNTTAYVLDAEMRLLPPYMEGEIHLGGPGVAKGYIGQPVLSAEKFIPNPFASTSGPDGQRLYRTGDRGRVTRHGEIEYLGRIDKQVKIRGYRIEPGEVEAALCRYPGVKQAHVEARPDPAGETVLCAWARPDPAGETVLCAWVVASASHDSLNAATLNGFLREQLPAFLIPRHIVFVAQFPTTSSGKLAANDLPLPAFAAEVSALTLPGMALEFDVGNLNQHAVAARLREIWVHLLGHDDFGLHSGFFEVGGNSLLAMRLRGAMVDCFKLDLTVVDCFRFPDIDAMSGHLATRLAGAGHLAPDQSGIADPDALESSGARRRSGAALAARRGNNRDHDEF